jgi:hypothetical protein
MVVWGGQDDYSAVSTGGRYGLGVSVDGDSDGVGNCDGDCDDATASVYPGAPQICDGLNNDCEHPGWPSLEGTNEGDGDGDTLSVCEGDCDDSDATIWGTPGETTGLSLFHSGGPGGSTSLAWSVPASGGTAPSMTYDVLRSPAPDDFGTLAVCLETTEGPDTTATDTEDPASGEVFHYLVRARNGCPEGQGPLGVDSSGAPRAGRTCP